MQEIPVYLFVGFLESGKTKCIQETLADERFNSGEKTLVLVCEEGSEEFNIDEYPYKNVVFEYVSEESVLSEAYFKELYKKYKFERVLIEYNGMWLLNSLFSALPDKWFVYQIMMFADAGSFIIYNQNMRQLTVDKLQVCEMVVFNRATESTDKDELHKIIRGISRRCQICYEAEDGTVEYDEIEDPLPFDIDAPVITVADEDFALWYRDLAEEMKKYHGKCVNFKGKVVTDKKMPKNTFVAGRHVMTCCEADIAYKPVVCVWDKADTLKKNDWINLTAKIAIESHSLYQGEGPVLYVTDAKKAEPPKEEVATFY